MAFTYYRSIGVGDRVAVNIFNFNAELFPASAAADNYLGKACLQKEDEKRALENFMKSVELDPEYVDANENLMKMKNKIIPFERRIESHRD